MKRMACVLVVLALAGLALVVNGCKEPKESETKVEKRVEETGSLKAQNKTLLKEQKQLEKEIRTLRSENAELKKQLAAESRVVIGLKKEIEGLKASGDAAVKAAEKAAAAETEAAAQGTEAQTAEAAARQAAASAAPSADELRQEREKRIAEITKDISDLESRITDFQTQIDKGKAKVSALMKAPVNTRATDVKEGEFRSEFDKGRAIEAARNKLLPLAKKLRPLEEKLAPLKEKLDKLRQEKIEEVKSPEEPEAVVTVLKHKETGEIIEGILTEQKINNLTVFKLADGGTKFINPDEWKTIEADDAQPAEKGDTP